MHRGHADEIVAETLTATLSERGATRMDDQTPTPRWSGARRKGISDADVAFDSPTRMFGARVTRPTAPGAGEPWMRRQPAAALHHRRQRRRRQEHADRPPAARQQGDPGGPARRARGAPRGGAGEAIDLSLLTDGLEAEREQGITIDVAYRYFATPAAQVHHRRRAGPRAVHAQHGHGREHGRRRGGAGRRAPRAAAADPPARLSGAVGGHSARRAGGQQDGPGGRLA